MHGEGKGKGVEWVEERGGCTSRFLVGMHGISEFVFVHASGLVCESGRYLCVVIDVIMFCMNVKCVLSSLHLHYIYTLLLQILTD